MISNFANADIPADVRKEIAGHSVGEPADVGALQRADGVTGMSSNFVEPGALDARVGKFAQDVKEAGTRGR